MLGNEMVEGVMLLLGGVLLIIFGFIMDGIGFLLLLFYICRGMVFYVIKKGMLNFVGIMGSVVGVFGVWIYCGGVIGLFLVFVYG